MKLTIRKKLLILSILAIVFPLIISTGVIILIVTQKTLDESMQKIRTYSSIATAQYSKRIFEVSSAAKNLAITALQYDFIDSFQKANPKNAIEAARINLERKKDENIMNFSKEQSFADYLILTDENGNVLYRTNNSSVRGDNIATLDPMLQQAIQTKKVIYGSTKLPIDFISNEKLESTLNIGNNKSTEAALAMEVVVPLILNNKIQGALIMGDVLNRDNKLVDELKQTLFKQIMANGSANLYLGDTAVASSRMGSTGRGIGETVPQYIFNLVLQQGKEFIGPETIGNINYISAYVPIKDISNHVIGIYSISIKETWFRQFQNYIRNFILSVILIAIFFSVILTYIMAGKLTKPIEEITEAANKISLGDLDIPIKVKTAGDEIERLGESLERMRLSLKSAIERLRRR